jgi:hypothetical protein
VRPAPRRVLAALIALAAAQAVGAAGVLLAEDRRATRQDLLGMAVMLLSGGVVLLAAIHLPVLAYLNRAGRLASPARGALLAVTVLNLPIYIGLALARRAGGLFAGTSEAVIIGVAFGVLALVFGWGIARQG